MRAIRGHGPLLQGQTMHGICPYPLRLKVSDGSSPNCWR